MGNCHLSNAKVFKAFCDETRLRVLELLRNGEKCTCILLEKVEVGQPTLSHHMKILVDSGVVSARKQGRWTYYSISAEGSKNAALLLRELTAVSLTPDSDENARCRE
jgi:ArsR family transcriptional regulator